MSESYIMAYVSSSAVSGWLIMSKSLQYWLYFTIFSLWLH